MTMAAALAYYTVFPLPALLVIVVAIAGFIFGADTVENKIQEQISQLVGSTAADQINVMRENADQGGSGNLLFTLVGIGTLIFGATGVFTQLQASLNRIWEVEPDPEQGGIKAFITKRFLSLGMVLTIAFLLLVAMVLSTILAAFGDSLSELVSSSFVRGMNQGANFGVSFLNIALLFGLIFAILPDAKIDRGDVMVGALATAALFVIGQIAIGLYFRYANVGSAFGGAGSLALVLVWIYYSADILLAGAEFTQAWSKRQGHPIVPEPGAVRVVEEKRRIGGGSPTRPPARATRDRKTPHN
jgi:membrane protein